MNSVVAGSNPAPFTTSPEGDSAGPDRGASGIEKVESTAVDFIEFAGLARVLVARRRAKRATRVGALRLGRESLPNRRSGIGLKEWETATSCELPWCCSAGGEDSNCGLRVPSWGRRFRSRRVRLLSKKSSS